MEERFIYLASRLAAVEMAVGQILNKSPQLTAEVAGILQVLESAEDQPDQAVTRGTLDGLRNILKTAQRPAPAETSETDPTVQ